VQQRLLNAGIRLAKIIDEIFRSGHLFLWRRFVTRLGRVLIKNAQIGCPLSGVKRTWLNKRVRSAFDPQWT
jgi:hypothetical protein